MADATAAALARFADPKQWVVRPGVPVFDEHEEYDEARLRKIAENCNRRESSTGDACPITIGHTVFGAAENQQPEIVGYARNFRVGTFGPDKKRGVLADFWFAPQKYDLAMTYPRRSVELWPEELFFDPISLLRRTPRRDLGLLTYGRRNGSTYSKVRYALEDAFGTVVRYQGDEVASPAPPLAPGMMPQLPMEGQGAGGPMPGSPAQAPMPPSGMSPDEEQMAERFMCHYMKSHPLMKHLRKKYGMEAGMPDDGPNGSEGSSPAPSMPIMNDAGGAGGAGGGAPGAAPAGPAGSVYPGPGNTYLPEWGKKHMTVQHVADPEQVLKMQKDLENHKEAYAKLQAGYEQLVKDVESERKARLETEKKLLMKEREANLQGLHALGYQFDMAEELKDCEEMAPEKFAKHLDKIKKLYVRSRPPVQNGMVVAAVTPDVPVPFDPSKELSAEDSKRVRDHALEKGIDYGKARKELFPQQGRQGIPIR